MNLHVRPDQPIDVGLDADVANGRDTAARERLDILDQPI